MQPIIHITRSKEDKYKSHDYYNPRDLEEIIAQVKTFLLRHMNHSRHAVIKIEILNPDVKV